MAKRIILVGGGHTHALVLRKLAMSPIPEAQVTLVNPTSKAPYTGMLPGYIAGHYTQQDVEIDLIRLARAANAQIILDEVITLDPSSKTISLKKRSDIRYDICSINIGITSHLPALNGFTEFGHAAKPLGQFANGWQTYLDSIKKDQKTANIVVVGGGIAGVELALAMSFRITKDTSTTPKITIIEQSGQILDGTIEKTKNSLLSHMKQAGVKVLTNATITKVSSSHIELTDGTQIESQFTVGAAGATPYPWLAEIGLDNENGFICVDETLTSKSDPNIFAAGDCAHFHPKPLHKAGVFAVRQAPILLHNLRAAVENKPRKNYRPQKNYLKLISTGGKSAVADKFGITLDGSLLWKLKDHIDNKFMVRLNHPPMMTSPPDLRTEQNELAEKYRMMCGGCGAKMDSGQLSDVLSKLPTNNRSDIISTPGDDAAIIKTGHSYQVLTTDHLRAFSNDPWLMGKIAAIHALGDIWAMGATPQAALASVILPPMADHLHASMLEELLSAATEVLNEAGAELTGGHTSIGKELTVGFSATGLTAQPPIKNSGAKSGDYLILTKPLGIGTILAAEMRGLADGRHVEAAYAQMGQPSRIQSEILREHARAMTDVTGFGLAGHLQQIMINSGTRAILKSDQVPFLEPAVTYAETGIRSSLWSSNRAAIPDWQSSDTGKNALYFDPQTAGGLLASIKADQIDTVMESFKKADVEGYIIGEVSDGSPGIELA